eukprot:CAMPEP_0171677954 /NCGR_PEP_ID=MMETSP0990-20121206/55375_1 /TAXON_ID=483369 /ORGANISM="non described non described, Strain CCMP2098" /LENGTH=133 /DNA_ID=CAMNT_0012264499 /DNA_START=194 /DNA_END=591 /DNA_ORIENTATION=+
MSPSTKGSKYARSLSMYAMHFSRTKPCSSASPYTWCATLRNRQFPIHRENLQAPAAQRKLVAFKLRRGGRQPSGAVLLGLHAKRGGARNRPRRFREPLEAAEGADPGRVAGKVLVELGGPVFVVHAHHSLILG